MKKLPATALSSEERDDRIQKLASKLHEIESRLIPTGLHVLGSSHGGRDLSDLLRMVASFDRPEMGVRALTDLVCEGLELPAYATLAKNANESAPALESKRRVDELVSHSIEIISTTEGLDAGSRVQEYLSREGCRVEKGELDRIAQFVQSIVSKLEVNSEVDYLIKALNGDYIAPGPGADLVQNPAILPTGRNIHAVNPYKVPSALAMMRGEPMASALLERHRLEHGRYPETIAMVLWGIDNIKSEGEAVAQALWLIGMQPRRDTLNRATEIEVIPLDRLGHPRIDVVMTVSGIFRDLFGTTMGLLDAAIRKAAELDEPEDQNFIRKHVNEKIRAGIELDEAAVRVFSNAPGNYGTNVNFMVMDSQWEESDELGDLFVTRKCFAYGRDSRGRSFDGRESRRLLEAALEGAEVTYQNIDSTEVGITDVDHYFEYLGGVTNAVQKISGNRPSVYLSDTLSPDRKVRTLEETVQLESRTKTLNPKWFEGMLRHGFSGVAEIEHRITNTFGWSATTDAVDDWIYEGVASTFVLDQKMLERLRTLNPHSARTMVGRLLEAAGRGFWDADESMLSRLQQAYKDLEDRLEGVALNG